MWYSRLLCVACLCFLSISFGMKLPASSGALSKIAEDVFDEERDALVDQVDDFLEKYKVTHLSSLKDMRGTLLALLEEHLDPSPRAPDSPCSFSVSSIICEDEFAFTPRSESTVDDENDDFVSVDFDTVRDFGGEKMAKEMFDQYSSEEQKRATDFLNSCKEKDVFDCLFEYAM